MKIVTSGSPYIDIDAYASCIAYAELLKLKGIEAKACSTSKLNESITPTLIGLNAKLETYKKEKNEEFIVIDVSDKRWFDSIIKENNIIEIIDHHTGYEEYWKNRLGDKANIELIGAVATPIVELYEQEGLIKKMSKDIVYLLMAAILDNTLNFKAKITTHRDIRAYKKLQQIVNDQGNYAKQYFIECQKLIEEDLKKAIKNDTKIEQITPILPPVFGQLTVWNEEIILQNKKTIEDTLDSIGTNWIMNIISLQQGKSYIMVSNSLIEKNIEKLLHEKFQNHMMICEEVFLRKEIIRKAREYKN